MLEHRICCFFVLKHIMKCFSLLECIITIIIIIINFYGAYILRNLSSEVQQNRIIKHNPEQRRAKIITRTRDHRRFMVEMQC